MEAGFGFGNLTRKSSNWFAKIESTQTIGSGILLAVNTRILRESKKTGKVIKIVFLGCSKSGNHAEEASQNEMPTQTNSAQVTLFISG